MTKLLILALLVLNLLWAERFSKNGEVIYDVKTKLSWQSQPNSQRFAWSQAIKHCQELSYGGYSDWQLPKIYELKSLVDYNKYKPAIATSLIDIKINDWYWSSSKYVSDSYGAWGVYFGHGNGDRNGKSDKNYVLCVREP